MLTSAKLGLAYGVALMAFLVLDLGWITLVVSPMYKSQLGSLVLDKPALAPAVLFYLLFLAGLVYFAVVPGLAGDGGWAGAALRGGLYGFFAYMTYALTNLSVIRGWTVTVAISDIAWGVVVGAVAAAASLLVTRRVLG